MSSHVLVIIGEPGGSASVVEVAREIATHAGTGVIGEPHWLAPDEAAEIALHAPLGKGATFLRDQLAQRFADVPVDIAVVATGARRKTLLVADMDSTIIGQECIDEMADVLGLKPKIAAITERAMRGELPFEAALRERLGLLTGITEAQLQSVYDTRVTLMPGARTLIATMKAAGAFTALVSGGFTFLHVTGRRRRRLRRQSCQHTRTRRWTPHRTRRWADPRARGETLGLTTLPRGTRPHRGPDARCRRRRQRPRHDPRRWPRRRLSRQAGRCRGGFKPASPTATSPRCSICRAIRRKNSSRGNEPHPRRSSDRRRATIGSRAGCQRAQAAFAAVLARSLIALPACHTGDWRTRAISASFHGMKML